MDTNFADLGNINITNALLGTDPSATLLEGSENLLFGYLDAGVLGVVTPARLPLLRSRCTR